jgi:hypothetical protein
MICQLSIIKTCCILILLIVFYYMIGVAKFCYDPLKPLKEMPAADFDKLPSKKNWPPEIKKGMASILVSEGGPPVLLYHFVIRLVHVVKAYGQYGQLTKQYMTACKEINFGLALNRVVVPHRKLCWQRLPLLIREMLQN